MRAGPSFVLLLAMLVGCGARSELAPLPPPRDAGVDPARRDAGRGDGGTDVSLDAGTDVGPDAPLDAGTDAPLPPVVCPPATDAYRAIALGPLGRDDLERPTLGGDGQLLVASLQRTDWTGSVLLRLDGATASPIELGTMPEIVRTRVSVERGVARVFGFLGSGSEVALLASDGGPLADLGPPRSRTARGWIPSVRRGTGATSSSPARPASSVRSASATRARAGGISTTAARSSSPRGPAPGSSRRCTSATRRHASARMGPMARRSTDPTASP